MTSSTVTTNLDESLNIRSYLLPQLTLHCVLLDLFTESIQLPIFQCISTFIFNTLHHLMILSKIILYCILQDLLGSWESNAIDVCQRALDSFLVWNLDVHDSSALDLQWYTSLRREDLIRLSITTDLDHSCRLRSEWHHIRLESSEARASWNHLRTKHGMLSQREAKFHDSVRRGRLEYVKWTWITNLTWTRKCNVCHLFRKVEKIE